MHLLVALTVYFEQTLQPSTVHFNNSAIEKKVKSNQKKAKRKAIET